MYPSGRRPYESIISGLHRVWPKGFMPSMFSARGLSQQLLYRSGSYPSGFSITTGESYSLMMATYVKSCSDTRSPSSCAPTDNATSPSSVPSMSIFPFTVEPSERERIHPPFFFSAFRRLVENRTSTPESSAMFLKISFPTEGLKRMLLTHPLLSASYPPYLAASESVNSPKRPPRRR